MRNDLIRIAEFCHHYQVEPSFVHELEENGLIETLTINQEGWLPTEQLAALERFIHLHYELAINTAGIDAIEHLLHRVNRLQKQVKILEGKLNFYR